MPITFPALVPIDTAIKIVPISKSLLQKLTARGEVSSVIVGHRKMYQPAVLVQEILERNRRDRHAPSVSDDHAANI